MTPAEQSRWFKEELQPHEAGLRGWLRRRFPWVTDVDDLIQESYIRLFQAKQVRGVVHPKSFLFTTAKNAALDRRRRQLAAPVVTVADVDDSCVLADGTAVAESVCHAQEIELLAAAIKALPKRRRLVLTLCKLRGWSHRRIAEHMSISEHTVSAHITQGLAQCRDYLRQHGVNGSGR